MESYESSPDLSEFKIRKKLPCRSLFICVKSSKTIVYPRNGVGLVYGLGNSPDVAGAAAGVLAAGASGEAGGLVASGAIGAVGVVSSMVWSTSSTISRYSSDRSCQVVDSAI